jgi:23S rRNA (cytidine1920-2'-O)/16S rRNA (cytidine1409-2'-O)-methyltransferase
VRDLSPLHVRDLGRDAVGEDVDLAVADLSFISLAKALPVPTEFVRSGGRLVALVKPQFELGPAAIGKGGLVQLPEDVVLERLRAETLPAIAALGWRIEGLTRSPVTGGDGNVEYLLAAVRAGDGATPLAARA